MFLGKSQHYAHVHKPWRNFGTQKKSENYQNNVISGFAGFCGFLRFFCGVFAGFLRGFAGFLPDRLRRCKYFLSFVSPSSKTCNQSLKIEDLGVLGKISWYRSNSENTYIFLGFGGSRCLHIWYGCPKAARFICWFLRSANLSRSTSNPIRSAGTMDIKNVPVFKACGCFCCCWADLGCRIPDPMLQAKQERVKNFSNKAPEAIHGISTQQIAFYS